METLSLELFVLLGFLPVFLLGLGLGAICCCSSCACCWSRLFFCEDGGGESKVAPGADCFLPLLVFGLISLGRRVGPSLVVGPVLGPATGWAACLGLLLGEGVRDSGSREEGGQGRSGRGRGEGPVLSRRAADVAGRCSGASKLAGSGAGDVGGVG